MFKTPLIGLTSNGHVIITLIAEFIDRTEQTEITLPVSYNHACSGF